MFQKQRQHGQCQRTQWQNEIDVYRKYGIQFSMVMFQHNFTTPKTYWKCNINNLCTHDQEWRIEVLKWMRVRYRHFCVLRYQFDTSGTHTSNGNKSTECRFHDFCVFQSNFFFSSTINMHPLTSFPNPQLSQNIIQYEIGIARWLSRILEQKRFNCNRIHVISLPKRKNRTNLQKKAHARLKWHIFGITSNVQLF